MLRSLVCGALLAGMLGVAPVAQARPLASLTLSVSFFADGTINVTLPDGTPVGTTTGQPTVIPAGAYTVVMSGPGGCIILPLFSLKGPGTNIVSDMNGGEVDAASYNAYLPPSSTFTWRSDRGVAAVNHTFVTSTTVVGTPSGSAAASGGTTASKPASQDIVGSQVVPFRGTLTAVVAPSGALTLQFKGKSPARLKPGSYHIAVADESPRTGLKLVEPAGTTLTLTAAPFVGRRTATVELTPGRWSLTPGSAARATAVVVG